MFELFNGREAGKEMLYKKSLSKQRLFKILRNKINFKQKCPKLDTSSIFIVTLHSGPDPLETFCVKMAKNGQDTPNLIKINQSSLFWVYLKCR